MRIFNFLKSLTFFINLILKIKLILKINNNYIKFVKIPDLGLKIAKYFKACKTLN